MQRHGQHAMIIVSNHDHHGRITGGTGLGRWRATVLRLCVSSKSCPSVTRSPNLRRWNPHNTICILVLVLLVVQGHILYLREGQHWCLDPHSLQVQLQSPPNRCWPSSTPMWGWAWMVDQGLHLKRAHGMCHMRDPSQGLVTLLSHSLRCFHLEHPGPRNWPVGLWESASGQVPGGTSIAVAIPSLSLQE